METTAMDPQDVEPPEIGERVFYYDKQGERREALVTSAWAGENPTVNVVFVEPDPEMTDVYGRQIARETSIPHFLNQGAPGNYWIRPENVEE